MKTYTGLGAVKKIFKLATAANDFLVASGAGVFVKKTLAEVKVILGLGSWTAYTPTATPDTGHFTDSGGNVTTSGKWLQIGKMVFVEAYVNIINKGSGGGGFVYVGLPFAVAAGIAVMSGEEVNVTAKVVTGIGSVGDTRVAVRFYDGVSPCVTGYALVVHGFYEVA